MELQHEAQQRPAAPGRRQAVGAVQGPPAPYLGFAQTSRPGLQPLLHHVGIERMPEVGGR